MADHKIRIDEGIHCDLFYASSAEVLSGDGIKIVYYMTTLKRSIPGAVATKDFDVVVVDALEGTVTLYRDVLSFDESKPWGVIRASLSLVEPT